MQPDRQPGIEIEVRRLQITASAGVAEIGLPDGTLDILIYQADQAVLSAQKAGRNRVQCYNCAMQDGDCKIGMEGIWAAKWWWMRNG